MRPEVKKVTVLYLIIENFETRSSGGSPNVDLVGAGRG
jgi:hypothetical protein